MPDYSKRTGRDTLENLLIRIGELEDKVKRLSGSPHRSSLDRGDTAAVPDPLEGQTLVQYDTEAPWYFSNGQWRPFAGTDDDSDGPWHYVGTTGEPAFQNGCTNVSGEEQLRFRLKHNGVDIDIDGAFDPGNQTNIVVFTLPTGYRPLQKVDLVLPLTTDDGFALAEIRTNGDVFFYGMFYGTPGTNQQGATVGQVIYVNGA